MSWILEAFLQFWKKEEAWRQFQVLENIKKMAADGFSQILLLFYDFSPFLVFVTSVSILIIFQNSGGNLVFKCDVIVDPVCTVH